MLSQFSAFPLLPTPTQKVNDLPIDTTHSSQYHLIMDIESFTRQDIHTDLLIQLSNLLKQKHLTEYLPTLNCFQRPCFMLYLDSPLNIDPQIDPQIYQYIEEAIIYLRNWRQRLHYPNVELQNAILDIEIYYQNAIQHFMSIGFRRACLPPSTLTIIANFRTNRIIHSEDLKRIRYGKRQSHGVSRVTFYKDIYWKMNPADPGIEFAVDLAYKLVTDHGCSPTVLLRAQSYDLETHEPTSMMIQASKAIPGILLSEMLEDHPKMLPLIDLNNFCFMFIMALLTLPQDGKGDNIIASNTSDGKVILTSIDNDRSFLDPICQSKDHRHFINVKTILFCLPQANEVFDTQARDHILSLSPAVITITWLNGLEKQNQFYDHIQCQNYFTKEECAKMHLPLRLRRHTSIRLFQTLTLIQDILEQDQYVTPNNILKSIYPALFYYYEAVLKKKRGLKWNLNQLFSNHVFMGEYFEDMMDLTQYQIPRRCCYQPIPSCYESITSDSISMIHNDFPRWSSFNALTDETSLPLLVYLQEKCTSKGSDNVNRDSYPCEELESLLQIMDMSKCSDQADEQVVRLLTHFSYVKFTLIGSRAFKAEHLSDVVSNSSALLRVELRNCIHLEASDLKVIALKGRQPEVIISGMKINYKTAIELKHLGLRLSLAENPAQFDLNTQVDSLYQSVENRSMMMRAIESLRTRNWRLAHSLLSKCEECNNGILAFYSHQIRALIINKEHVQQIISAHMPEFIQLLVEYVQWDINQLGSTGESPWHLAIIDGHIELCQMFISLGANIHLKTLFEERTALHLCIIESHLELINVLFTKCHSDQIQQFLDPKDRDGNTPLSLLLLSHYPSSIIQTNMATTLIRYGSSLNLTFEQKDSLLHMAIKRRLVQIAKILISNGIDINQLNIDQESPLHLACLHLHHDYHHQINQNYIDQKDEFNMVNYLIEHGANISALTRQNCTIFHYAVRGGNKDTLNILLSKNPSFAHICDNQNYNLIHEAARQSPWISEILLPPLLSLLVNQIDNRTIHRKTPLMIASQCHNLKAIRLLVKAGANLNLIDDSGDTALMWCVSDGYLEAIEYLIQAGANPNIFNESGISATWRSISLLYKEEKTSLKIKDEEERSVGDASCPNIQSIQSGDKSVQAGHKSSITILDHSMDLISLKEPLWSKIDGHEGEDYSTLSSSQIYHEPSSLIHPRPTYLKVAKYLLHHGGILDQSNSQSNSLVHILAHRILKDPIQCPGIAEFNFLIQHQMSPFLLTPNIEGDTILHILCSQPMQGPNTDRMKNNIIALINLIFGSISNPSQAIYRENNKGYTVLHCAILIEDEKYIRRLIIQGGLVEYLNQKSPKQRHENHPLLFAIQKHYLHAANLLIELLQDDLTKHDFNQCLSKCRENNRIELFKKIKGIFDKKEMTEPCRQRKK